MFRRATRWLGASGIRPSRPDRSANSPPLPWNGRMTTARTRAPRPPNHWLPARTNRRPRPRELGSRTLRAVVVTPLVASNRASSGCPAAPVRRYRPATHNTMDTSAVVAPLSTSLGRMRSGRLTLATSSDEATPASPPAISRTGVSPPPAVRSTRPAVRARHAAEIIPTAAPQVVAVRMPPQVRSLPVPAAGPASRLRITRTGT